jgi:hypothetical protein
MRNIILIFSLLVFIFSSCNSEVAKQEKAKQDSIELAAKNKQLADSLESCTQTIKDPNNPKPMALMMRMMAANADSMRSQLLRGERLDSNQYGFIKFYLVEPTDPKVLEANFYEKARLHQFAYKEMFRHPNEQKKYYNLMIQSCVNCHLNYCSGPLKRINKFPIP